MQVFQIALFAALLAWPGLVQGAAASLEGRPVTSMVLQDDRGLAWPEHEALLPLAAVKPGDPFSGEAVRKGLAYLYLKKQFRDVTVDAFPDGEGVRLVYTLYPVTIVNAIVLRGNHFLSDRDVREAMGSVAGKELREESFTDLRSGIQARYQAAGFSNVRVNFLPKPAAAPYRADLYVYITEPKRTFIEAVRFTGNKVLSAAELEAVMRNRRGRPLLTNTLLEEDLSAIRTAYVGVGHPAAAAGPVSVSFPDGRAVIEIAVNEGPRLTVSFAGTRSFCADQFPDLADHGPENDQPFVVMEEACAEHLRGQLLFAAEHDVSDTVIESSAEKLRIMYRDLGYADVRVQTVKNEGSGTLDLLFQVEEGPRVRVEAVQIEGSRDLPEKRIRESMAVRPPGWFRSQLYREDELGKDLDAVSDLYAASGYLDADVRRTVTRTPGGAGAVINITITEGRKTVTGAITFEGNAALSTAELSEGLGLQTGKPFVDRLVEEDRYRILSRYADRGYLYARVEAERTTVPGKDADSVNIRYRIHEDQEVRIGTVILRGNVTTRDAVILRELEPRTGEPYRYESILKSQQRVYRYGYFGLAKFEPVRPNEKEAVKDMLFTVEERPAGAVEVGVGYGDLDRLRGFAEVSHRNLWGSAHFASVRVEGSDILQRAAFTYQFPWFLGFRNLDNKIILAWSDSKRINQDTRDIYYQTRKTSATYGVERTRNTLKVGIAYQYENVENYNVRQAAELTEEDSGRVRISSLNPSLIWDLRDDPFDPRRGSVHGATVKEAMSALGSEADFTKATVQTSWYLPAAKTVVLALSGRAGMAWAHQDTLEVPIHERFYLGGSTTVRGYIQDSIGPGSMDSTGTFVPTGGSSMVQLNAELRFASASGTGVVVFTDAGNVWVDQHIQIDDLRASFGAGFRYSTPVGPLRIDYGQKIHRRTGESPGELHFNIGHAF